MNILITGGLGYVGGRLASYLYAQSRYKISLTTRNKSTALASWVRDFDLYQMDLSNTDSINECIRQVKPDTIIHLGVISQQEAQENPELATDVNVQGTQRLLNAAVEHNLKKFIYFSTFQVYGQLSGVITETSDLRPNNQYSQTKLEAEKIVFSYSHKHDFKSLVLRLSNAYGCPMDKDVKTWHLVFNAFCKKCVKQGFIDIRSNQYRDFIALQDVAKAVNHFLNISSDHWQDGLFNLGGECCLSVVDVAQKVANIYQERFGGKTIFIEDPVAPENNQWKPFKYRIDKLKKTGFQLTGDMETEIVQTLDLCQKFEKEGMLNG